MADLGNIGLEVKVSRVSFGAENVIDLLGLPSASCGRRVEDALPALAGNPFTWEQPGSQAIAALSGATPGGRLILLKQGCFAGYYAANQSGECVLRRLDYGDYLAVEYGPAPREWSVQSSPAGITVTPRNATTYPTIPLGSRLLVMANGKIKAVTPT